MIVTASKCALTEDLPEPFDQVEPRGGSGQRDKVEAWVAPVPQHRLDASVQRQRIYHQIGIAGRSETLQPIEKLKPRGGIASSARLDQDPATAVRQLAECPAVAVVRIRWAEVRAVRAGVPLIRFHDLRHTAATLLLKEGIPVKVVSESLGHSDVAITLRIYAHVLPDMQAQATAALERVFGEMS